MENIKIKIFILIYIIIVNSMIYSKPSEKNISDDLQNEIQNKKNQNKLEKDYKEIEESWLKELKEQDIKTKEEIQNNTKSNTTENKELFKDSPSFLGIVFRFFAILGIFGIFFYYFIRFLKKKNLIWNDPTIPVQVMGSVPLMSGKFLQIIDIAGQIVILGISENNISLIQIVDNAIIAEKIRLWHENYKKKQLQSSNDFKEFFQKLFGKNFSFWHEKENKNSKYKKDFYTELTNQDQTEIRLEDLKTLIQIQKENLKKFKEL